MLLQMTSFPSFSEQYSTVGCVCVSYLLYPLISYGPLGPFHINYYKQCCYEHWGAHIFSNDSFSVAQDDEPKESSMRTKYEIAVQRRTLEGLCELKSQPLRIPALRPWTPSLRLLRLSFCTCKTRMAIM